MNNTLIHGDCIEEMKNIPDNSVDLILSDPPYYRVKKDKWDNQWKSSQEFIDWLSRVADQWQRILKPNGSLYCFSSHIMAARVEVMLSEKFNILNNIVWAKSSGYYKRHDKSKLRSFAPQTERIVFCEQYGSDNNAKGEAGYLAKCDELRGFIFDPIRLYFVREKQKCGITSSEIQSRIKDLTGKKYVFVRHAFSKSQWELPTEEQYKAARVAFRAFSGREDCLSRGYESLRGEYESLRGEYESLRRPFSVDANIDFTDVWNFKSVQYYPGKHPCEKPLEMLRHIISVSTNKGAIVLDSFMGTGNTGIACRHEGRNFVGIELDEEYFRIAKERIQSIPDISY